MSGEGGGMPISPSFLISSAVLAKRFSRRSKNSCRESALSISHSFLSKWSHKVRPGSPEADECAESRVSKDLSSRINGRSCGDGEEETCDLENEDGSN